jgi:hypothetical protein
VSLDHDANRGEDNLVCWCSGIIWLDDLLAVQTAKKLQVLGGMNWGTASWLLRFAEEDRMMYCAENN